MDLSNTEIRKTSLQEQGDDDLFASTTVEERMAMMWQLAVDAWAFMGVEIEPEFPRHVVRVVRRDG